MYEIEQNFQSRFNNGNILDQYSPKIITKIINSIKSSNAFTLELSFDTIEYNRNFDQIDLNRKKLRQNNKIEKQLDFDQCFFNTYELNVNIINLRK